MKSTSAPPIDEIAERRKAKTTPRADVRRSEEAQKVIESLTMKQALEVEDGIIWPDGQKFMAAKGPEAIGAVLVKKLHLHLRDYRILYLFREKIKSRDRIVLGKASKADPKLAFFTDATFVMEINHECWWGSPADAKVALIDHELSHFGIDIDDDGEKAPILLHHDIEEFARIIERWGLWKNDVRRLAEVIQLGLALEVSGEPKKK